MSDMQSGAAPEPRPSLSVQKRPRDVPLPMMTLDFDGIGTVTVTLEGVTDNGSVYGTPSEMDPTQQLTQDPSGSWTGNYTPGVDTTYTIGVQDPGAAVERSVATVVIPAGAVQVTAAAMPRPDVDVIVPNTSYALFCADSTDGQVFSDPSSGEIGLSTAAQPAACDLEGVLTVAAVVGGAIQMKQRVVNVWRVVDLGSGLPTSDVQSIALAEFGGKAFLAVVRGFTLDVYRNTASLESDWVAVLSFGLSQPYAGLGLCSNGRALMLGWNDAGRLRTKVTTNADQPNWTAAVEVMPSTLFGVGPAIASVGTKFVLASVASNFRMQVVTSSDYGATWSGPSIPTLQSATFVSLTRHFGELYLAMVVDGSPQISKSADGGVWGAFTVVTSRGVPWQGSGPPAIAGGPPVQPA